MGDVETHHEYVARRLKHLGLPQDAIDDLIGRIDNDEARDLAHGDDNALIFEGTATLSAIRQGQR